MTERPPAADETARKLVHVFYGLFALALRWLTPAAAVGMAAAALLHNRFLLPRYAPSIVRSTDRSAAGGLLLYPAAVLRLVLLFPGRPDLVAAAWAVLAFGDGCAALAGRRSGAADTNAPYGAADGEGT